MARSDDFRLVRHLRNGNRFLQIVLGVLLVIALNYLAARHFERWDLTKNLDYTLSLETEADLRALEEPVRIIIAMPQDQDETRSILADLRRLLREYEFSSRKHGEQKVFVEFIDPFQERFRAQEIAQKYGVEEDIALLVISGDRHRLIDGTRLYETNAQGEPTAFRGEQLFTSAILDVARAKKQKIYFVTGHGEMPLQGVDPKRGLSQFFQFLRQRGFEAEVLDLTVAVEVPEDADAVFIMDPSGTLLNYEVEKLRTYMSDRRGRMAVYLEPGREHGLDPLLFEWGILAQDMAVADAAPGAVTPEGKVLVRYFDGEHPVTELLAKTQLRVVGTLFRPVRPDPGAPLDERLETTPLMASSEQSWGEAAYRTNRISYDADRDLAGPVPLATVAERRTGSRMDLNLPGGRLIAFGNGAIAANEHFSQPGNRLLMANTVNWLLDRDELLNIPPRRIESMSLALTQDDLSMLAQRFLIVPGALALLGLFVYLLRRR